MNEKLENMAIERVAEILKGETFYYQDVECCVISDAEECYMEGYKDALNNVRTWLDTNISSYMDIENDKDDKIKVDLQREIRNYLDKQSIVTRKGIYHKLVPSPEVIAKHFFELGLKAQKGGEE